MRVALRRCPLCHREGIVRQSVDRVYRIAGTRRVVRGILAQRCPHCGEIFLDLAALDRIDKALGLKRARRHRADAA